jgi:hypothetical protein
MICQKMMEIGKMPIVDSVDGKIKGYGRPY